MLQAVVRAHQDSLDSASRLKAPSKAILAGRHVAAESEQRCTLLCTPGRQPHKQHLQLFYSFDDAAAALHIKAELTSLIEADHLDSDLQKGATQDCMCLTLGKHNMSNKCDFSDMA